MIISLTHDILAADITRRSVENIQDIAEGEKIKLFFTVGAIGVLYSYH
jgi:hypothetical protein